MDNLTALLAARVMGWKVGPDRFTMGDRRWLPRWRFQPTKNLGDAFRLLDAANPREYSMRHGAGGFWVQVQLQSGGIGEVRDRSKPRAIARAVAIAFGIEVENQL